MPLVIGFILGICAAVITVKVMLLRRNEKDCNRCPDEDTDKCEYCKKY